MPRKSNFLFSGKHASSIEGLSEAGKEFIISALDPYHDFEYTLRGIPDNSVSASFNRQVKTRTTINKPAGIAPGTNWDLWVLSGAVVTSVPGSRTEINQLQNFVAPTLINVETSAFSVYAVPSGTTWTAAYSGGAQGIVIPLVNYEEGDSLRIVGAAVECTDTTPILYKGGDVTCFKSAGNWPNTFVNVTTDQAPFLHRTFKGSKKHPGDLSEAQALHGSVTWAAKDGCLMVGTQDMTLAKYQPLSAQIAPILVTPNDVQCIFPVTAADLTVSPNHYNNMRPFGCCFHSLQDQAAITITTRINVEIAPKPGSIDVFLGTRPEDFDPHALAVYANLCKLLPPGVPVGFNAHGDWFNMILAVVKEMLPSPIRMGLDLGQEAYRIYMDRTKVQPQNAALQLAKKPELSKTKNRTFAMPTVKVPQSNQNRRKPTAKAPLRK